MSDPGTSSMDGMTQAEAFKEGLSRYLSAGQLAALRQVRVGFAGAGGLGSNACMLLARSGVENFVLVDGDTVDHSNLNRQHYFPCHVGRAKVAALAEQVRALNPEAQISCHECWLSAATLPAMLEKADIWVEALDEAGMKRRFVEAALHADCFVASASGIAGYGGPPMQKKVLGTKLVLVGDFSTDISQAPPLAPRVMQAAAMQADAVLEYILNLHVPNVSIVHKIDN